MSPADPEVRSRTRTVTKNTLWSTLDMVLDFALPVFTSILVARVMGPSKLGEYTYILWITQMALLIGSLGIPQALARYLAEHLSRGEEDEASAVLRLGLWLQAGSASMILAIGVAWALLLLPEHETVYALVAVSSILPAAFMGIATAIHTAREDFASNVTASIGGIVIQTAGVIVTLVFDWDLEGLAAALLLGRLVDCGLRWTLVVARRPADSRLLSLEGRALSIEKRREVLEFCGQATVLLVLNLIVWNRSEMFFLKRYCELSQVAFFSLAFTFANIPQRLAGPFSRAAVASLFVEHGRSPAGARHIAATASRYMSLVVFPAAVGLAVLSGPLVRVLYGSQYAAAAPVLAIAAMLGLVAPLAEPATGLMTVGGGQRLLVRWGIVAAALTLALDLWLVQLWCAVGGAVANGSGQIISAVGIWAISTRRFGFALPRGFTLTVAVGAAAMGLVALGAGRFLPDAARLVVVPPVGAATFLLFIRYSKVLGAEDVRRLRAALSVLPVRGQRVAERFLAWLVPDGQLAAMLGEDRG